VASDLIDVCDAVVAIIDAAPSGTWSGKEPRNVERKYSPMAKLHDDKLRVWVVPNQKRRIIVSRADRQSEYDIDIGILKKLETKDPDNIDSGLLSEIDPLITLTEEIDDYLAAPARRTLTGSVAGYGYVDSSYVLYDREIMAAERQFVGLINLTYRYVLVA
jgi:hypothetical protein